MNRPGQVAVAVLWMGLIVAGFWWQSGLSLRAGAQAASPPSWPETGRLSRRPNRHSVLVALHPRCPCSRATLTGLEEFAARFPDAADVTILLSVPTGAGREWTTTPICERVRAIPRFTVVEDEEGRIASAFGMQTSVHVLIYNARGDLAFSGGITAGRGPEGPTAGLEALFALGSGSTPGTPVFGCPLVTASECQACEAPR